MNKNHIFKKNLRATHLLRRWGVYKKQPHDKRLSQRHPAAVLADLKRISDESGISQVSLVAACILGLKKTWEKEGEISFPFLVVSEKKYAAMISKENH